MTRIHICYIALICLLVALCACDEDLTVISSTPLVVITYPAPDFRMAGPDTVRVEASDPEGIVRIDFLINGQVVGSSDTKPYQWFWQTDFWGSHSSVALTARAVDGVGDLGYSGPIPIRMPWSSAVPQLIEPSSGSQLEPGDITLSWTSFEGAASYEYEISDQSSFGTILFQAEITGTTATVNMTEGGHYYCHVRALDAGGHATGWSIFHFFDIVALPVYVPALTPFQLLTNFATSYGAMDVDGYEAMLDDRFFFFFNSGGEFWNKAEDMISTDNMFSGEARINDQGYMTRAISEISVDQMLIREAWESVSASHPHFGDIPGAQKALYQARLVLFHSGGTFTVESNQTFFAAPTTVDGVTTWSLIGQQDEASKANEDSTWGNLKNFYR